MFPHSPRLNRMWVIVELSWRCEDILDRFMEVFWFYDPVGWATIINVVESRRQICAGSWFVVIDLDDLFLDRAALAICGVTLPVL